MAEYEWTTDRPPPPGSDRTPSIWLQECLEYLSTVMSSVLVYIPSAVRTNIYQGALSFIADGLMVHPSLIRPVEGDR